MRSDWRQISMCYKSLSKSIILGAFDPNSIKSCIWALQCQRPVQANLVSPIHLWIHSAIGMKSYDLAVFRYSKCMPGKLVPILNKTDIKRYRQTVCNRLYKVLVFSSSRYFRFVCIKCVYTRIYISMIN